MVHVHFGTRLDLLTQFPRKPFIVHYHGTDIRSFYYDPAQRAKIQWGADNAAMVLYSTPDLAPHAEAVRADAVYLPNPVNLLELPSWRPAREPVVVFSSRWDRSKGGDTQLELLAAVRRRLGDTVRIQGLDWGSDAGAARDLGAELLPKMRKSDFLNWLANAHCVVGQTAGILAMSELQALAIGVPVVAPLGDGFYPGPSPVAGGSDAETLAASVVSILNDPMVASRKLAGRQWIEQYHHPEVVARQLSELYASL